MTNLLPVALAQRLFFVLLSSLFTLSAQTLWAEELAAPEFSHESGFYPEEFELVISHPDPEAKIYYTLDGSDPDPENLKGTTFRYKNEYAQPPSTEPIGEFLTQEYKTFVYDKPIVIKDRTYEQDRLSQISTTFDVKPDYFPRPDRKLKNSWQNKLKATINKVIAKYNNILNKAVRHYKKYILNEKNVKTGNKEYFCYFNLDYELVNHPKYSHKGMQIKSIATDKKNNTSQILIKLYFIEEHSTSNLPIVNISLPEKKLFDYDEGILVAGSTYEHWLSKGDFENKENKPSLWPFNWQEKNNTPAYITIFDRMRDKFSETHVELRPHGNSSKRSALKSLRIYPDKTKSKAGIKLDLFRDDKVIGLDRINFRNSGNTRDSNYPTDAAIHKMMSGLNFAIQRYQPVSLYINGEYYGILNARDRKDHYYISSLYNLPNRKIDLLKLKNTVQRGDSKKWDELLKFVESYKNKNDNSFYDEISEFISIDSFIDYYIAELFIANTDWPNNNIAYWRYKGAKKHPITNDGFTDGRWRWIMYDTDAAGHWLKKPDINMLDYTMRVGSAAEKPAWSTLLLREILKNKDIKENFIIRFSDLLNSHFIPERTIAILRSVRESVINDMPKHIERWNQKPRDLKNWMTHINKLTDFFEQRQKYQWQHLQEFFELNDLYSVQVDINEQDTGKIELNTLSIGGIPNQEYRAADTSLFFPWSGQYFKGLPLTLKALPKSDYAFSHWEISGQNLTVEEKSHPQLILKPRDNLKIKAVMVKVAKP